MARLVFASFYTPEYEGEAAGLAASLHAVGMDLESEAIILPRVSLGGWARNAAMKAAFLLEVHQSLEEGDRIVWLDADARMQQDPRVFFHAIPDPIDFGVHFRDGQELLSGTLYLRVGQASQVLLNLWKAACEQAPGVWDQRVLQQVLFRVANLAMLVLQSELCCIPDLMPSVVPVILHRQASRQLKMVVGP